MRHVLHGEYVTATHRDSQPQRYQVRVRGHLGETPGLAAPSPGGLHPEPRPVTWGLIESVRDSGVTIVLVTHFMEEAERLCDRVALIDRGRVVALGEPAHLAGQAATATRVRLRAPGQWMLQRGGRRRTSSSSSPSASISASTP